MNSLYIPVSVIDGFFDNPDEIVEYAKSLEYSDKQGNYPGVRTDCLSKLNPDFFNYVINRFLNIFYDTEYYYVASMTFQKICHKEHALQEGWVHKDSGLLTFLIYLSKDPNSDAGTSIFSGFPGTPMLHVDKKHESFEKRLDNGEFREENNKQFKESIRISNEYNRLVAFDSPVWHKANDFNKERLTLICFIKKLDAQHKPIEKMRRT